VIRQRRAGPTRRTRERNKLVDAAETIANKPAPAAVAVVSNASRAAC
jgi:hypothetical protein